MEKEDEVLGTMHTRQLSTEEGEQIDWKAIKSCASSYAAPGFITPLLFILEARETWQSAMETSFSGAFESAKAAHDWIVANPEYLDRKEQYWAVYRVTLNKPEEMSGGAYFFSQAGENMPFQPRMPEYPGLRYVGI